MTTASYLTDLDRLVQLLRDSAPAVSVQAVVDQVQAAGGEHPEPLIREYLDALCVGAVAAAGTSDRATWERFVNATRALGSSAKLSQTRDTRYSCG